MNSDILKGQWKQLTGKAKAAWSRLPDDDLLRVEGNVERLSGVIQERYGVTRAEAEDEVQNFIDRHLKPAVRTKPAAEAHRQ